MARARQLWFRWYVEAASDPKILRLTPAERWLFVDICAQARSSFRPPLLLLSAAEPLQSCDIASHAHVDRRTCKVALAKMEKLGLVARDDETGAWYPVAFATRQFESDNVTERSARHRSQRAPSNAESASMQRCIDVVSNDVATPPYTETETEVTAAAVASDLQGAAPPSAAAAAWVPSDEALEWARRTLPAGVDVGDQTERYLLNCADTGRAPSNGSWANWMARARPSLGAPVAEVVAHPSLTSPVDRQRHHVAALERAADTAPEELAEERQRLVEMEAGTAHPSLAGSAGGR